MNIPEVPAEVIQAVQIITRWARMNNHEALRLGNVMFAEESDWFDRRIPDLPEANPYGYLYESEDGHFFDYAKLEDDYFKKDIEIPLYTHPAPPSELVMAAEEIVREFHGPIVDKLRSALGK